MKRLFASTGLAVLAVVSTSAMAQDEDPAVNEDAQEASAEDEDVAVSRAAVDAFVAGDELVQEATIGDGECVPTTDEEYMRTGVETICAERGSGPINTYFARSNSTSTPAPSPARRTTAPRRQASTSTPRRAPTPRPIRIPERCAPTQSESLNMCLTFGLGSANLTSNARSQVRVFAQSLVENESSETFIIAGHTDTSGTDIRNCELSQERAQAVVAYMVEIGVSAEQLRAVGFGQERLQEGVSPTDARNRRVEIVRGDADAAASQACGVEAAEVEAAEPA